MDHFAVARRRACADPFRAFKNECFTSGSGKGCSACQPDRASPDDDGFGFHQLSLTLCVAFAGIGL